MLKKRHSCLTAWLIFLLILNSLAALGSILGLGDLEESVRIFVIISSVFHLVCLTALFNWKKWGFWGYIRSDIIWTVVSLNLIFISMAKPSHL